MKHEYGVGSESGGLIGGSANDIRDLLIDRLAMGQYQVGSRLPTAHELAAELGVHRNTVAKSYRMLAELGLISTNPGRGTFVIFRGEDDQHVPLRLRMERAVEDLVLSARRIGINEPDLRAMLDEHIAATYTRSKRRGAFVECNWADVHGHIAEVESITGIKLEPILLDDVLDDVERVASGFDVLFTSLFHIKELSDAMQKVSASVEILALSSVADEKALEEIARIRPGSRVVVVASNLEGGHRFANMVRTYAQVDVEVTSEPDDAAIREIVRAFDVIVCTRSRVAQVRSLKMSMPFIALPFRITPHSAVRVAEALGATSTLAG